MTIPYYIYAGLPERTQKSFRRSQVFLNQDMMPVITQIVFDRFNVGMDEAGTDCREQRIVKPRKIAMYLIRNHLRLPLKVIGQYFGGRDHSTVISACTSVQGYIDTNKGFAKMMDELEALI